MEDTILSKLDRIMVSLISCKTSKTSKTSKTIVKGHMLKPYTSFLSSEIAKAIGEQVIQTPGMVITRNTIFSYGVYDFTGKDGIVIGADNIRIDGNGAIIKIRNRNKRYIIAQKETIINLWPLIALHCHQIY